jgi:hypothetical protein
MDETLQRYTDLVDLENFLEIFSKHFVGSKGIDVAENGFWIPTYRQRFEVQSQELVIDTSNESYDPRTGKSISLEPVTLNPVPDDRCMRTQNRLLSLALRRLWRGTRRRGLIANQGPEKSISPLASQMARKSIRLQLNGPAPLRCRLHRAGATF